MLSTEAHYKSTLCSGTLRTQVYSICICIYTSVLLYIGLELLGSSPIVRLRCSAAAILRHIVSLFRFRSKNKLNTHLRMPVNQFASYAHPKKSRPPIRQCPVWSGLANDKPCFVAIIIIAAADAAVWLWLALPSSHYESALFCH